MDKTRFDALRTEIEEVTDYLEKLQTLYRKETGKQFVKSLRLVLKQFHKRLRDM